MKHNNSTSKYRLLAWRGCRASRYLRGHGKCRVAAGRGRGMIGRCVVRAKQARLIYWQGPKRVRPRGAAAGSSQTRAGGVDQPRAGGGGPRVSRGMRRRARIGNLLRMGPLCRRVRLLESPAAVATKGSTATSVARPWSARIRQSAAATTHHFPIPHIPCRHSAPLPEPPLANCVRPPQCQPSETAPGVSPAPPTGSSCPNLAFSRSFIRQRHVGSHLTEARITKTCLSWNVAASHPRGLLKPSLTLKVVTHSLIVCTG